MTTLPYDLEEQWKERDKMGGLRFSWWVKGIKEGLIACGCDSCNALLSIVVEKEKTLTQPEPTTKQYRITKTFLVTLDAETDVEDFWSKITDEGDFEEDEHIELVSEI